MQIKRSVKQWVTERGAIYKITEQGPPWVDTSSQGQDIMKKSKNY